MSDTTFWCICTLLGIFTVWGHIQCQRAVDKNREKVRRLHASIKAKAMEAYKKTSRGKQQAERTEKGLTPINSAFVAAAAAGMGALYLAQAQDIVKRKKARTQSYARIKASQIDWGWNATVVTKTVTKKVHKPVPTKTCEYCDSPAFAHQTHCEPCGAPLPKG